MWVIVCVLIAFGRDGVTTVRGDAPHASRENAVLGKRFHEKLEWGRFQLHAISKRNLSLYSGCIRGPTIQRS
jgi:hypothetical protein